MPTMYPSAQPLVPDKSPSQGSPLSPEWTHAITILMGQPLSSEPGKHIKKWIIYHRIHKYTMFALKWNPTQFKLDIHLQMYPETDGSLAYLKSHTVKKLDSLMKYMSLLIWQDRPNAEKHHLLYFISGNQLFELTAHDMKSALINEKLENHRSQKYSLIKTNHGYVNLNMNEDACYGKGHTIHSSGQIEWHKNQVNDKSVKVRVSQCITNINGYSFLLKCTEGLVYLSIMGKPTDAELVKYPTVHLTSIGPFCPRLQTS